MACLQRVTRVLVLLSLVVLLAPVRAQEPDDPFSEGPEKNRLGSQADEKKPPKSSSEAAGEKLNAKNRTPGNLKSGASNSVASDASVREALESPTRMEFVELPLADAMQYLGDHHGIQILLDLPSLEDAGVEADTPMTMKVREVSLRAGLCLLLADLELDYVVRDGVLLITTKDQAAATLETHVYDISDEVGPNLQAEEVADTVIALYLPHAEKSDARALPGFKMVPLNNLLIVRASQHDHEELTHLFREIKSRLAND